MYEQMALLEALKSLIPEARKRVLKCNKCSHQALLITITNVRYAMQMLGKSKCTQTYNSIQTTNHITICHS